MIGLATACVLAVVGVAIAYLLTSSAAAPLAARRAGNRAGQAGGRDNGASTATAPPERIAYASNFSMYQRILGASPMRVSVLPHYAQPAVWSPDGRYIAYYSSGAPKGQRWLHITPAQHGGALWVEDSDGRNRHRVWRYPGRIDATPGWSPDDNQLAAAYEVTRSNPYRQRSGIVILGRNGGQRTLVSCAGANCPTFDWPAWSRMVARSST